MFYCMLGKNVSWFLVDLGLIGNSNNCFFLLNSFPTQASKMVVRQFDPYWLIYLLNIESMQNKTPPSTESIWSDESVPHQLSQHGVYAIFIKNM